MKYYYLLAVLLIAGHSAFADVVLLAAKTYEPVPLKDPRVQYESRLNCEVYSDRVEVKTEIAKLGVKVVKKVDLADLAVLQDYVNKVAVAEKVIEGRESGLPLPTTVYKVYGVRPPHGKVGAIVFKQIGSTVVYVSDSSVAEAVGLEKFLDLLCQ